MCTLSASAHKKLSSVFLRALVSATIASHIARARIAWAYVSVHDPQMFPGIDRAQTVKQASPSAIEPVAQSVVDLFCVYRKRREPVRMANEEGEISVGESSVLIGGPFRPARARIGVCAIVE